MDVEPSLATPIRVHNVALSVIAILAFVALLRYAQELFVPLALSMLIAFALNPFVSPLERIGMPRTLGAAIVVVVFIFCLGASLNALRPQATIVLEGLPDAIGKLRTELAKYRHSVSQASSPIGKIQETATEIEKTAAEATANPAASKGVTKVEIEQPPFRANDYLWSGSMGLLG